MKPILFNAGMVRAILESRKTVTRRVVKPQPTAVAPMYCYAGSHKQDIGRWRDKTGQRWTPPCNADDILWVRETWAKNAYGGYFYRADETPTVFSWNPSIHMPKEAARLFLRVTVVRVERLRDMCLADVLMEGIQEADSYEGTWGRWHETWNSTIKPADLPRYGWEANPWVWVIEFERISKEAALGGGGDD